MQGTLSILSQLWIWGAIVIGLVITIFVLQNKKVKKVLTENADLITVALNSVKGITDYLEKTKKLNPNIANTIKEIREVGLLAVTSAEEQANGGQIDPTQKYTVAKEIAKTLLKQSNITLSDKEIDTYLNSALNIAKATGLLSESKKKKQNKQPKVSLNSQPKSSKPRKK